MRVSVCHCLECQKRSGSAFAVQARWADADVAVIGAYREWSRRGDSGALTTFRFCPDCGSTLAYVSEGLPGLTAVAVGAFANPGFPPPAYTVFSSRRHPWVTITGAIELTD